jgi:predicted metal-dependent phosphotriesterase family hydrolase
MAIVRTVTGEVEADELGPTSMHEHIFGDFTVWQEDPEETASLASVSVDPTPGWRWQSLGSYTATRS